MSCCFIIHIRWVCLSLASISATDFDLIVKSLADNNIESNQKFQKLKSLGYFVTSDTDETLLCEQKYMDIVEERLCVLLFCQQKNVIFVVNIVMKHLKKERCHPKHKIV